MSLQPLLQLGNSLGWPKISFKFSAKRYRTNILEFPCGSAVKNLPAVQETQEAQVRPLSGEDPLEKEVAPHSSILAWRIPWTEEPGGIQAIGLQRVGH